MLRLRRQVICDVMRNGDQMLRVIPCFGKLEQTQYLGTSWRLINKNITLYSLVGGLIGIYLNSTAALAEVEEVSEDLGRSNSSISTLASGLSIDPLIDNYDNISDKDVDKYHLAEDIIPEAVWNLHNSQPIHLDRIRDGVELQIYTGSDAHFESPILWTGTAFTLWNTNSIYEFAGWLRFHPLQFQVASCGGSQAEHKDLDYCSVRGEDIFLKKSDLASLSGVDDDTSDNVGDVAASPVNSTSSDNNNNQSALTTDNQSVTSSSTPTATGNALSQGALITLEQCRGASGLCAIVDIDLPATPVDLPATDVLAPATDDLAPPTDVPAPATDVMARATDDLAPPTDVPAPPIAVLASPINLSVPVASPPTPIALLGDPGPELDLAPVFTPSPLKPIPEASTWVMTIIGFGSMIILYGRDNRHRIKQVLLIAVRRLAKKLIYDLLHSHY